MSQVGYLELLRTNRGFRRLWIGDVASLLGDWFNTIALYVLIRQLTGSPLALAIVFVTKALPFALASPVAGLITDRFSRRRLMIGTDIARAIVVLGFLLVRDAGDLYLAYILSSLQVVLSAVFIPARSASIPNITTDEQLLTANALSAATWSTLLAIGAALGGFVTEWLGVEMVFVLDSASYVVSALLIAGIRIPQRTERLRREGVVGQALRDIAAGWRYMRSNAAVGRMALVKAAWSVGGGGLVYMLALLGEEISPAAPAIGMGLLFSARGLGTGIGPIAMRAWVPEQSRWPAVIGIGIVFTGAMYLLLGGGVVTGLWILLLVMLAHSTSGANWVASTVLLQSRSEDRYRGRVFATEWLILQTVDSISMISASLVLEAGAPLATGILVFAGLQLFAGFAWLILAVPAEIAHRGRA